ncbi:MAG: ABC transporter ATP-binding protein, partial [Oscillospiraceae bacterium]|nr:ABC transporter ATP-binding protein [Oscillospiraceae bacterium]
MKKGMTAPRMLSRFLAGAKRWFLLAIAAAGVSIIASFLMPRVIGYAVDGIIAAGGEAPSRAVAVLLNALSGGKPGLFTCVIAVAVCAVASGVFNLASRAALSAGSESFIKTARDTLFSHIQSLPFKWHTENQTGDIIQRCTSDVETTRRFVSDQLIEVTRTVILLVVALIMMFSINVTISLVVTAFVPLILGYTVFFNGRVSREFRRCDEAEGDLTTSVQENLTGVRVVRAFGREKYETDKFDRYNDTLADKWIALGYTLGVYWGVGDIVSAASLLAVITVGGFFAADGKISLGDFIVFISLTQNIAWPVRQMGRTLSEMSKTGVSLSRLREILDAEPEPSPPDAVKPPMDGDIVFENVSFTYGENEVLRDINLRCPGGGTLGILGATGSGKSTLAYLLTRLFELPE